MFTLYIFNFVEAILKCLIQFFDVFFYLIKTPDLNHIECILVFSFLVNSFFNIVMQLVFIKCQCLHCLEIQRNRVLFTVQLHLWFHEQDVVIDDVQVYELLYYVVNVLDFYTFYAPYFVFDVWYQFLNGVLFLSFNVFSFLVKEFLHQKCQVLHSFADERLYFRDFKLFYIIFILRWISGIYCFVQKPRLLCPRKLYILFR